MKAFSFRLEQALRWKSTQVDLAKARVSEAAARLAGIQRELSDLQRDRDNAGRELARKPGDGATLAVWPAWDERMRSQIARLTAAEQDACEAMKQQMAQLVEANQKLQLLENLKASRRARWNAEFAQELEAFAAESFLGRLQSKRTGA